MDVSCYRFEESKSLQGFPLEYLNRSKRIFQFYNDFPDKEGFRNQIDKRIKNGCADRKTLVSALFKQYETVTIGTKVGKNIQLLENSNTFTVVTGHQLNLMTGPLYFVHKIHSAIRLSKQLKEWFPEHNFVPIYWMATEDHDFEEINHFYFQDKKVVWDSNEKGAVGRFNTKGLDHVVDYTKTLLPNGEATELIDLAQEAYNKPTFAEATRFLVNKLFKEHGLVCIDGDDPSLKKLANPVFEQELINQTVKNQVSSTNHEIENLGFTPQVQVQEFNLFYLQNQSRERIEKNEEKYVVRNTSIGFTQDEILTELNAHPERFSPNASFRPVYQEYILPNIAYLGGGAEVSYWLQLKNAFKAFGVHYPAIVLRDTKLILSSKVLRKLQKLSWDVKDAFNPIEELKQKFLEENKENLLEIYEAKELVRQSMEKVQAEIIKLDTTLIASVNAAKTKQLNALEVLEKKEKRAWRRKNNEGIERVKSIHAALYPNGTFQERRLNLVELVNLHGLKVLNALLHSSNPTDFRLKVIVLD